MMYLLRRVLVAPVLLALAIVLQVTLVNRLPLPGGAAPDVVLLVVLSLAATGGPVPGMLAGFLGGLALDVAPPGSDLAGENALVFCLVGYGCGALAAYQQREGEQAPLLLLPVVAVGAVAAEALQAGLGMMLSDPGMTVPAIKHVLPAAVVYDLLLSPFVLLMVAVPRGRRAPEGIVFSAASSAAKPGASAHAALRAAGARATPQAGAVPRLTFADTRPGPLRAPSRPEVALRFSSGSSSLLPRTGPASAAPRLPAQGQGGGGPRGGGPRGRGWLRDGGGPLGGSGPRAGGATGSNGWPGGRTPKVGFGSGGRDGVIGGSVIARGGRPGSGLPGSPGGHAGGLRAGAFSAGSSGFLGGRGGGLLGAGLGGALGPSLFAGTSSRGPGRNWLRSARHPAGRGAAAPGGGWGGGSAGGTARSVKGPKRGWLRTGSLATASWKPAGPGKGWLKPSKPVPPARRRSPGRGWLASKPAMVVWKRKPPGRGWLGHGPGLGGGRPFGGRRGLSGGSGSGYRPARTRIGGRR